MKFDIENDAHVKKVIAEFMNIEVHQIKDKIYFEVGDFGLQELNRYTESIDAQIPAIIKLAKNTGEGWWLNVARHGVEDYHMAFFRHSDNSYDTADCVNATPQQISARAIAKAIIGLKD